MRAGKIFVDRFKDPTSSLDHVCGDLIRYAVENEVISHGAKMVLGHGRLALSPAEWSFDDNNLGIKPLLEAINVYIECLSTYPTNVSGKDLRDELPALPHLPLFSIKEPVFSAIQKLAHRVPTPDDQQKQQIVGYIDRARAEYNLKTSKDTPEVIAGMREHRDKLIAALLEADSPLSLNPGQWAEIHTLISQKGDVCSLAGDVLKRSQTTAAKPGVSAEDAAQSTASSSAALFHPSDAGVGVDAGVSTEHQNKTPANS